MKRYILSLLSLTIALIGFNTSCTKVPVGYLNSEHASYRPNSIEVYRQIDLSGLSEKEQAERLEAPQSSTALQGLSGTAPITYSFHSVKASEGGDEAAFLKTAQEGNLIVRGGYIQLRQRGISQLPVGKYTISIRVSNEGHEAILSDIFSFIVKEQPEEAEDTASSSNE